MTALGVKQAELAAVLKKLADLDTDLAEKVTRKENLEAEVEMCKVKLDRWVQNAICQVCVFAGTAALSGCCQVLFHCPSSRQDHVTLWTLRV
jgi:hypothetical protein